MLSTLTAIDNATGLVRRFFPRPCLVNIPENGLGAEEQERPPGADLVPEARCRQTTRNATQQERGSATCGEDTQSAAKRSATCTPGSREDRLDSASWEGEENNLDLRGGQNQGHVVRHSVSTSGFRIRSIPSLPITLHLTQQEH